MFELMSKFYIEFSEFLNKTQTNKKFKFTLISFRKSVHSEKHWAAAFEVRTDEGHLIEGPLFVIVNDENGESQYLRLLSNFQSSDAKTIIKRDDFMKKLMSAK